MVLAWLGVKGDLIDGVLWRTTVESGFRELAPVLAVGGAPPASRLARF